MSKTFSDKRLVDTKARVRLNPLSAKSLLRKAWPFYAVALTEVLLQRVDVLVLSLLGNPTLTGIYGAAYSVVRVLLKLIQSYWKALYPTISRLRLEAEEQYQQIRLHGLRYGSILILLCAALGAGGAEGLLGLVYRTEIDSALLVFRILIWTAPIFLIETYCVLFLMVEQRPTDSLFLTMLHVAVVFVLLPLLSSFAGAVGIAWTMIIAGLAGTAMGLWLLEGQRFGIHPGWWMRLNIVTIVTTIATWHLPLPWPIRMLVGSFIYIIGLWATAILDKTDWERLRRAVEQ